MNSKFIGHEELGKDYLIEHIFDNFDNKKITFNNKVKLLLENNITLALKIILICNYYLNNIK